MTIRFPKQSIGSARRAGIAVALGCALIAGGCSSDEGAEADVDVTSTVPDDPQIPAIDPSADEAPIIDDAVDPEYTPSTQPPTDPAVDSVGADAGTGDRAALDAVLADALDPVSGGPVRDLEGVDEGLPETWRRNSTGAEVRLDESALLACANNQFAWVDLQSGATDTAAAWLAVASVRADRSEVGEIHASANGLAAASLSVAEAQPVADAFLALCTARGFEV